MAKFSCKEGLFQEIQDFARIGKRREDDFGGEDGKLPGSPNL
jgi:hypothetical protein